MRKLMAALVLAGLVLACTDQPTAPQQRTPAVSADFMNNPDGGGAVVDRYGPYEYVVAWNNNPTATVRAYHTTFPLSWAVDGVNFFGWEDAVCGPENPTPGFRLQEVAHWDHTDPSSVWLWNGVADVWIALVDRTSSGPCNTRPIIASGWGKLRYTDNNATAACERPCSRDPGLVDVPGGGAADDGGDGRGGAVQQAHALRRPAAVE